MASFIGTASHHLHLLLLPQNLPLLYERVRWFEPVRKEDSYVCKSKKARIMPSVDISVRTDSCTLSGVIRVWGTTFMQHEVLIYCRN